MSAQVTPIAFPCLGTPLMGMLHAAEGELGAIIVVGGPQTRVGSHRQFVKLAQALQVANIPTLRFDTRGMGDSHGAFPGFTGLTDDINAAVAALLRAAPQVKKIVLWGLCDGASAILIGAKAFAPQVVGFVLVNPWVHAPDVAADAGAAGESAAPNSAIAAKAQVKLYYAKRIVSGAFWKKLLSGKLNPLRAAGEFAATAKKAAAGPSTSAVSEVPFVEAMRQGWYGSTQPALVLTAGDDLVAQEWLGNLDTIAWKAARHAPTAFEHIAEANHTFASAQWRGQAEAATLKWIQSTF